MRDLTVTLVQTQLQWESPADNRAHFERLIRAQAALGDVVVLPEMFTTGFSMNALANAEPVGGATYTWLHELARELDVAITGSVAIDEQGAVYNRLLFATPMALRTTISGIYFAWPVSTNVIPLGTTALL